MSSGGATADRSAGASLAAAGRRRLETRRSADRATAARRRPSSASAVGRPARRRRGRGLADDQAARRHAGRRRRHSAVTKGGAKLRATTASWLPRQASLVGQHLGPRRDAPRPGPQPSRPTTRRSQSVRPTLASSSVSVASGRNGRHHESRGPRRQSRGRALGSPPRSGREPAGVVGQHVEVLPSADEAAARLVQDREDLRPLRRQGADGGAATEGVRAPRGGPTSAPVHPAAAVRAVRGDTVGPIAPATGRSAGASTTVRRSATVSRPRPPGRSRHGGTGSSPSDSVLTPVDVGEGVVHDLAIGGGHRLQRLGQPGLDHLLGHLRG